MLALDWRYIDGGVPGVGEASPAVAEAARYSTC
jgi:hypothetical protein